MTDASQHSGTSRRRADGWVAARCRRAALLTGASLLGLSDASAAVIPITPADNYTKIEAAQPGDEVVIAPGTYRFRVHLTAHAPPTAPIYIHAQDPNHKPVWDLSATLVENAPGSYTAGDRGRGGWQVDGGANYQLAGLVFTGCHTSSRNSAGLRYYHGTTGLVLKDCLFRANDNGLTGGTENSDVTVEFCELDHNGDPTASAPTHNLYIYGGTFTLRYSYVHDTLQAENFHVRAHDSTLEYNWFARATNYEGDLMTDDDFSGPGPFTQAMTLRGNVFVQSAAPANHGQVLVSFNDTRLANDTMSLRVIQNTFVGNGGNAAFVHLSNADGTTMTAEVSNNLISGTGRPTLAENLASASLSGANNWLAAGGNPGPLSNSVFGASPGFKNPAAEDYTLAPGSAALGAASLTVVGLPIKEYYLNEVVARQYRLRATARDIGAFESATTGPGIGPYDTPPAPRLGAAQAGNRVTLTWPLTAADYLLDQRLRLANANAWTQVPSPYTTNPPNVCVTLPLAAPEAFYRLRRP